MNNNTILKMQGITKLFGPVKALNSVDFELRCGEVHALLGENGSGKSTLVKVLGGIHKAKEGKIFIEGKHVTIASVNDAQRLGISIVHQELSFAPDMTVADNIFMGKELCNKYGFVSSKQTIVETEKILRNFGSDISPAARMSQLSISQQQVVEIAKALSNNAKILVMDEPSASLSLVEVSQLYETIDRLKKMGISIIYISHRMEELFRLGDRVTVLRDGNYIGTRNIKDVMEDELVTMMVGREIHSYYVTHEYTDEVVLELKNLKRGNRVKNVNIKLHKGEVIGIAGIVGAGRTEFARIVAGIDKGYEGQIILNGEEIKVKSPDDAITKGIALIPEDRKTQGLVLIQSVNFNTTLCVLKKFIKMVGVNISKQNKITDEMVDKLDIKVSSREMQVSNLSGGNQQKVVLAKWLATQPTILILDEPTRGIDVGAKAQIYDLIDALSKDGMSTIVISSDLPEIMRVCDTVYVMRKGKTIVKFSRDEMDQEKIIRYATGVIENAR